MEILGISVIGAFPSKTTHPNFAKDIFYFSYKQIHNNLGEKNLMVKYDGITKSLGHLVEVEIESSKGPLMLD